jgi:hypothetical protein
MQYWKEASVPSSVTTRLGARRGERLEELVKMDMHDVVLLTIPQQPVETKMK